MNNLYGHVVKLKQSVRYTKVQCPFGSRKDLKGATLFVDEINRTTVANEYGTYPVDIDERDIET